MSPLQGGYYEVTGYGVGVGGGARDAGFGLGGDRFARSDAASPQQVPAAALPPGYAYYYQPPPTTYQYGVYPVSDTTRSHSTLHTGYSFTSRTAPRGYIKRVDTFVTMEFLMQ